MVDEWLPVAGNRGGGLRVGGAPPPTRRRGMFAPLPGGERKQEEQGQQSDCEGYSDEVEFAEAHGRHPVVLSPRRMLGRRLLTKGLLM